MEMHSSHAVSIKKEQETGRDVLDNSSPCYVKPEAYKKEGEGKAPSLFWWGRQLFEVGELEGWAWRRDDAPYVLF